MQNVSFSWLHFNFQFLQILFKNFKNFSQSVDVNFIDPAKDFLVEEVKEYNFRDILSGRTETEGHKTFM